MRKIAILLSILVCTLFLFSCSQKEPDFKSTTLVFSDDAGNSIHVEEKPKKVAVLFSSHAEMVLLAGGSVDITVGESVERGFVNDSTPLVDSGAGKQINTELLISHNPDFVVGSFDVPAHREASELLNTAGIPCALFRVEDFSDYERVMKILCDIFENDDAYQKNVAEVNRGIDDVLSRIPDGDKKKILFVRCASSSKATKAKTKKENFVCAMLDQMNTYNIAESAPVLQGGLSTEEIILQNPDYIFFSTMGDENAAKAYMTGVLESDQWQTLDAVKNGNYTFLDKELFQYKPNNRWDKAYKILAELLYGKD